MSFYETSSADHGPFDFAHRQKNMLTGVEALPVLLDDAKDGKVAPTVLGELKNSILHLVRSLSVEWFTASVLKGIFFFF